MGEDVSEYLLGDFTTGTCVVSTAFQATTPAGPFHLAEFLHQAFCKEEHLKMGD